MKLIRMEYVIMLRKQYPDAELLILLNQCDTKERMDQAARIGICFDSQYSVILR